MAIEKIDAKKEARRPQIHPEDITEEMILSRLKKGPAKKAELVRITRTNDRAIAALQAAGGEGRKIINMQDRTGGASAYKIAESKEELEAYKAQETARATTLLHKIRAMEWEEDEQVTL